MKKWEAWKRELFDLKEISLGRCIKSRNFRTIIKISLHNFSDASEIGYGQCSYLRVVDENENIHCSLIMDKTGVAPRNFVFIRRLELVAVVLSVKISNIIKKELQLQGIDEYFRTESRIVLGDVPNNMTALMQCRTVEVFPIKAES